MNSGQLRTGQQRLAVRPLQGVERAGRPVDTDDDLVHSGTDLGDRLCRNDDHRHMGAVDEAHRDRAEQTLHEAPVACRADDDLVTGVCRVGNRFGRSRHLRQSIDVELRVDLADHFDGPADHRGGAIFVHVDVFVRRVHSALRAAVHRHVVARHDENAGVAAARLVRSPPQRRVGRIGSVHAHNDLWGHVLVRHTLIVPPSGHHGQSLRSSAIGTLGRAVYCPFH